MTRLPTVALAALAAASLILSSCGSSTDPLGDTGSADADAPAGQNDENPAPPTDDENPAPASDDEAAAPVVIGSANFTESELIAGIYAAALQASGVEVETKLDIGSREVYLQALEEGAVTVFPEYTGGLLAYYDPDSTSHSSEDVYADLVKAIPDDLTVLDYSPAQDQDSVTVTAETAEKYGLTSIGDLAPYAGEMTLGGSSEWQTRADGPDGMKKVYGVEFGDYKVLDPGGPLSVKGLTTGLVDATDIFTTDPAISENDFVVLEDPENLFLAQNIVPLVASSAASDTVVSTLNDVSKKLTTDALTQMLTQISETKADPGDIAQQWVTENGLG